MITLHNIIVHLEIRGIKATALIYILPISQNFFHPHIEYFVNTFGAGFLNSFCCVKIFIHEVFNLPAAK